MGPTSSAAELAAAIAQRDRLPPAPLGASGGLHTDALTSFWQYLGPNTFHQSMNPNGVNDAQSGRINAIAADPQHRGTWYAGAPYGGVWKTTDSGANWAPLTDNWKYLSVSSLAVDPHNPSVIYAGTGDFLHSGDYAMGVMKSSDGGASWAPSGLPDATIPKIMVDPDNSNNIIALTVGGDIEQSTDAGAHWNAVTALAPLSTTWTDLVHTSEPASRTFFAVADHSVTVGNHASSELALFRSDDHGGHWTELAQPLPPLPSSKFKMALATSAFNVNRLYLYAPTHHKVLVSNDSGGHWTDITGNLISDGPFWSQPDYTVTIGVTSIGDIRILGAQQDLIYVGGKGVYRNIGGGATWQAVESGHPDSHALTVDPFDRYSVMLGNDGGIYQMAYVPATGGHSITSLNAKLGVTEFYTAAYSLTNVDWMVGGTQDTGTVFGNGSSSSWLHPLGGDGGGCAINPLNPNSMYITDNWWDPQARALLHTSDGWKSSQNITPSIGPNEFPAQGPAPMAMDSSGTVYTATNYLYRYEEATNSWSNRLGNQDLAAGGSYVEVIAVAQNVSNRIYTGARSGRVWMTFNGGSSWTEIDSGAPGQEVADLSLNPNDENDILAALNFSVAPQHLWRCTNPFAKPPVWTDVSATGTAQGLPPLPIHSVTRDPRNPASSWLVGTDVGVFYTDDAGLHWFNATAPLGLPNVMVSRVTAVPSTNSLYAATFGRGLWRACLPSSCQSAGVECGPMPDGCGGQLQCGGCGFDNVCQAGTCVCQPHTCRRGLFWNPDTCSCEKGPPQ
jgi:photosystem II stability/assembly factor-like uncharacterized protein